MDHFLNEAKRLVQRLQHHDNAVDILIGETTNLQNKLIAMRQYKDEVVKMNQSANHRPKSTLILGSQLENQRIQSLEQENRELSISLAEHQSALELIMNKYREQVLVMIKANGTNLALSPSFSQPSEKERQLNEQIAEMAYVMRKSASIDENLAAKEIETIRSLQVENDNLRQLLQISGQTLCSDNNKSLPKDSANSLQSSSETQHPIPTFSQTQQLSPEPIDNKDSGIYEEEYSPNFDLFKKGKKRKPLQTSRHVDNLENLFKMPPSLNKQFFENEKNFHEDNLDKTSFNENVENATEKNNMETDTCDDQFEHHEEEQHQMYTVEALIEKDIPDKHIDDPQLTNGHIEEDLLLDDLNAMLEEEFDTPDLDSNPSDVHESNLNNDFKDVVVSNTYKEETNNEENDALKFLDDALDFSDENFDCNEGDDEVPGDVECFNKKNASELQQEENLSNSETISDCTPTLNDKQNKKETEVQNEINVLDLLDTFDKEIEGQEDSCETLSEADSEVTIIDTNEEDSTMALFDSVLENDDPLLSNDEGND